MIKIYSAYIFMHKEIYLNTAATLQVICMLGEKSSENYQFKTNLAELINFFFYFLFFILVFYFLNILLSLYFILLICCQTYLFILLGIWEISEPKENPLIGDNGLVLSVSLS